MNMNNFRGYATQPAPNHFQGEDVIGDALYSNQPRHNQNNQIPQQLQSRMGQQNYQEYEDPNLEEINIEQPINVNNLGHSQSTTVVKNVVINLVVNLKINAI